MPVVTLRRKPERRDAQTAVRAGERIEVIERQPHGLLRLVVALDLDIALPKLVPQFAVARCQAVYALFDGVDHFTVGFVPRVEEIAAGADGAEQVERKSLALFQRHAEPVLLAGALLGNRAGRIEEQRGGGRDDRSAVARRRPCAAVADACAVDGHFMRRGLRSGIIAGRVGGVGHGEKQIVERFDLYANQSGVGHVAKGPDIIGDACTAVGYECRAEDGFTHVERLRPLGDGRFGDVAAVDGDLQHERIQSLQYAADAVRGVGVEYVVEHHAADGEGFAPRQDADAAVSQCHAVIGGRIGVRCDLPCGIGCRGVAGHSRQSPARAEQQK